jgi:hypothetical protein
MVSLVLDATAEPAAEPGSVGWGTPHLICDPVAQIPPRDDRPNIILVSIDTLRADHLGVYGYARPTSPRLDAFAGESLVFDHAFATSPWTLPSHASLLTWLYPNEHGAGHANVFAPLEAAIPTLAERLKGAGYRTLADAVTSAEAGVRYAHPSAYPSFREATGTDTERAPGDGPNSKRWRELSNSKLHRYLGLERFRDVDDLIAGYDSTIRFVDAQLGVLFDHLGQLASSTTPRSS